MRLDATRTWNLSGYAIEGRLTLETANLNWPSGSGDNITHVTELKIQDGIVVTLLHDITVRSLLVIEGDGSEFSYGGFDVQLQSATIEYSGISSGVVNTSLNHWLHADNPLGVRKNPDNANFLQIATTKLDCSRLVDDTVKVEQGILDMTDHSIPNRFVHPSQDDFWVQQGENEGVLIDDMNFMAKDDTGQLLTLTIN